MREMSATEASRNFATVLDQAEHGETIMVTRQGRRIATISPVDVSNGAAVLAVMREWSSHELAASAADELERNVATLSEILDTDEDRDPWAE